MGSLRVMVWGFLAGLLALPLPALAGWDTFSVHRLPSGSYQVQPSVRTMLADAMGAGFLETPVSGRGVVAGASGAVPVGTKSAAMRLGWGLSGGAVATLAARALPVVAGAGVVYEVARAVRCYAAPGAAVWGGLLECDAGVDPTLQSGFEYQFVAGTWYSSLAAAIPAKTAQFNETPGECSVWNGSAWVTQLVYYTHLSTNGDLGATWRRAACPGYSPTDYYVSVSKRATSTLKCADGSLPTDADGKCATGTRLPATVAEVASKLESVSDANLRPDQIVRQALEKGGQSGEDAIRELGTASVTGPASVTGDTRTVTPPGGGSPVTVTTTYNVTYNGDTFNYTETTSGSDGSGSSGTPDVQIETCGLPGKPACKIDETGTPTGANMAGAEAALAAAQSAAVESVGVAAHSRADLPWTFSLSLPVASCSAFVWETRLGNLVADPCSSSGVALWRSLLAWMLAALTGFYIWRSVTELNG